VKKGLNENMPREKKLGITVSGVIKLVALVAAITVMIYLVLTVAMPEVSVIKDAGIGRGVIRLAEHREFDYEKDLFVLSGEWEFYPNQLLYSEDFMDGNVNADSIRYVSFPHYWRDDPVNFPDGTGYATYRMTVQTAAQTTGAGIFSQFQYGAYRVYLNGNLIGMGGNVSENTDDYYFAYNGSTGYIWSGTPNSFEVIVQLQSYDHEDAGLVNMIIMGSPDAIRSYSNFIKVFTGAATGAVTVLALYFLIIFIRNRNKSEYMNYAIVSFCGLYLALTNLGENHAYYWVPEVSNRLLYAFEHVALVLGTFFASIHVIRKYIKYKYTGIVLTSFVSAQCLLLLILPPYQVSVLRPFTYATTLLFLVCAFTISIVYNVRSRRKGKDYSMLESMGLLVLVAGAVISISNPTLYLGFDLFCISVIIYCFMKVFVVSGHYRRISEDLFELNKTLENRVAERTAALVEMNRKVEAADNVKSEFLTRMSREIRTPMNAIVSISELFDTQNLNEIQKNYFYNIKETSHSILNLINDIMDFSRIEAGRLELTPAHFNLNAFIENICSTARYSAGLKGLHYESTVEANIPEVIYGDEVRMKQVIANILSNAVKYTRDGSVKLNISTTAEHASEAEKMLLFTVTDTGEGMSREEIKKVFDAFMNPELGNRRGLKGTGLGMAICKKLMDMQNGVIEFISAEGKGSEVKLYFPLRPGDENLVEDVNVKEKIYAKNAKILIVEDNTINVTVALDILAAHDIRPDVAKDGYKALSMIKEKEYDLVFMDQFLPGMDGIETTQRIRELGGKYRTLPIVAMTCNVVHGARDMLIFKGLSDYIAKPVCHNALNNILIRWLPHDKISSALGRFNKDVRNEFLSGLPVELVEITEINCNAALKNMDGSVEIFMGLLRRFTAQADEYAESLNEYLKAGDYMNYIIVVNGAKSLLYNIGAKACGDMAAKLEKAAAANDEEFCLEQNDRFCEHLKWLSQRVMLALPQQNDSESAASRGSPGGGGLVKLAGIMHDLSFDYSIGDCASIDKRIAVLKESSFGKEHSEIISKIISESNAMEYERAAELCKKILNTLMND